MVQQLQQLLTKSSSTASEQQPRQPHGNQAEKGGKSDVTSVLGRLTQSQKFLDKDLWIVLGD
jgi:hypothetical protein